MPLSCPAEIGRRRGHVKLIVGQIIGGLQPTESAEVVELVVSAGELELLARGVEVAGIALKEQGREAGGAVGCGQADDAAFGAGAIEIRIRAAIDLGALDCRGGERAEVEVAAQIAGIDAVEEDLVVVGVAAADEERGLRAELPVCTTKVPGIRRRALIRSSRSARSSGPSTVVAALVCGCGVGVPVAVTTMDSRTHAGSSTTLRSMRVELAGIEVGRLQLAKALGRDDQKEAAARCRSVI